jgi:bidirectional [NiFe] hydrogenase diaphorase subunit
MEVPEMPEGKVSITIDGRRVTAREGETILDAARREGVHIPTLCYLKGLSVHGGCRLCVVEVAEDRVLRPACATTVSADMEITTTNPNLAEHRRTILELLFAEGNHICAVCVSNGHCELQDEAVAAGMDHVRYEYQCPQREVDASHPKFVFDPNRCILCTRCVRVCGEVEGAHVWDVASRGAESFLVAELNRPWGESRSCTWCGKCVAVCPTGALAYKGKAVAEMRHDPELVEFLTTAREAGRWHGRV